MKKIFIGLLAFGTISSFAQVAPSWKNPANRPHVDTGVMVSVTLEVRGVISDKGQTVEISNLSYKDENRTFGITRRDTKYICKALGYSEMIKGSDNYRKRNYPVLRKSGFMVDGPNKVLDSIECLKLLGSAF